MATALLGYLVFYVDRCSPCLFHRRDCSRDIKCAAPSCINVHEQRELTRIGDAFYISNHVIEAGDTQVRQSIRCVGYSTAAQVDGLMTSFLRLHGAVGVNGAHDLKRAVGLSASRKRLPALVLVIAFPYI